MCSTCWIKTEGKWTTYACSVKGFSYEAQQKMRAEGYEPARERFVRLIKDARE